MDISAFQLFKNNNRTNMNARLHATPIVDYGRIIRIIDIQTVVVEKVVNATSLKSYYTVTLLNLSSALFDVNIYPQVGDTVLLLFLRQHDARMFMPGVSVKNSNATGYNQFSGVGVLMSAAKSIADTVVRLYKDGEKSVAAIDSIAEWRGTFNGAMAAVFCRAVFDEEDEQAITMLFGEGRPLSQKFLDKVTREYGFWEDSDGNPVELDAAVTERYSKYALITRDIQGEQKTDVGLGVDKDANPIETDAPITEVVHGKSPITRDIRSPQDIIIGIGNDETEDAEENRDAPVAITLGGNANITVSSKSNLTAEFDKKLDVLFKDKIDVVSKKAVTIKSDSTELIEIRNTVASLGALISEFVDLVMEFDEIVTNLDTVGSPALHATGPIAKPKLTTLNGKLSAFKSKWGQVFK